MITKLFAVQDIKAQGFNVPFSQPTRGLAIRSFTEAANDPQTPIFKYPADYVLYEIGTFDDETGIITSNVAPEIVIAGSDAKLPATQTA